MSTRPANVTPRRAQYEGFNVMIKAIGTGEHGRRSLTFDEARSAMGALLTGEATPAQAGAFLIAMRIKGEEPEELAGIVQGLRDAATPLRASGVATDRPIVVCAGAFDGVREAPHLALAAGLVAAAAGAAIVEHCGTTLGPKYGTTTIDVLQELGGPARPTPQASEAMLADAGFTVVHAAEAIRGWETLAVLRDQIGPRGPVHSAEKLVDWFGARRMIVGYTHQPYAARLVGAMAILGAVRGIAVKGIEGSNCARPGRPVARDAAGPIDLPEQMGDRLDPSAGPEASAELTLLALAGRAPRIVQYAVVLNAALRLEAAGLVPSVLRGIPLARGAIADGRAQRVLRALTDA